MKWKIFEHSADRHSAAVFSAEWRMWHISYLSHSLHHFSLSLFPHLLPFPLFCESPSLRPERNSMRNIRSCVGEAAMLYKFIVRVFGKEKTILHRLTLHLLATLTTTKQCLSLVSAFMILMIGEMRSSKSSWTLL